jgi:hypothetical protein
VRGASTDSVLRVRADSVTDLDAANTVDDDAANSAALVLRDELASRVLLRMRPEQVSERR